VRKITGSVSLLGAARLHSMQNQKKTRGKFVEEDRGGPELVRISQQCV